MYKIEEAENTNMQNNSKMKYSERGRKPMGLCGFISKEGRYRLGESILICVLRILKEEFIFRLVLIYIRYTNMGRTIIKRWNET